MLDRLVCQRGRGQEVSIITRDRGIDVWYEEVRVGGEPRTDGGARQVMERELQLSHLICIFRGRADKRIGEDPERVDSQPDH
jgi:hypothetical protein